MKPSLLFLMIIFQLSCHNQSPKTDGATFIDTSIKINAAAKIDNSKYYTTQDSLIIYAETNDTLAYGKQEFNGIIDHHPEFNNGDTQNPDLLYQCNGGEEAFSSEAGQDNYYKLYAYFLTKRNGDRQYAVRRNTLIALYSNINLLFQQLENGGTYFGHQQERISGYAEYAVYLYKQNEKLLSKTYDIKKQKALYINALRQMLEDEVSIDTNTIRKQKPEKIAVLNKIVDKIGQLITDHFYLERTEAFHYGKYEYY